jgi:tRNA/rRNA methyltransferase
MTGPPTQPTRAPAIVLVEPQLGENVGFAARAMANCGLADLRLVRPREPWPNPRARETASGADAVIDGARVFDSTAEAAADLHRLYATTARPRDQVKPVLTPPAAAAELRAAAGRGEAAGVLFGPERTGLENDDVARADALIVAPLDPAFRSLNLGQAVLLVAWEWWQAAAETPAEALPLGDSRPANREELEGFFDHLFAELDATGFLRVVEKRPIMVRNLRNLFLRAQLTEKEVRALRGVVKALSRGRGGGTKGTGDRLVDE